MSAQLHCMSDASTCGYGQCSYLRLEDENVSFIMGKARVAPKKAVSIPRLELAAAMISVKIGDVVKNELEYENIEDHYWMDSKVVLGFVSNALSRFHMYVANRVQLIHDYMNPLQWHHVDTTSNTADEGSRGMLPKDFMEKSKWIKGPDFLKEPAHSWLKEETYEHDVDPKSPEVKNMKVNTSVVEENDILKRLQRFSSWQKAKIAVVLCLRCERKLRDRVLSRGGAPCGEVSGERSASHALSGTGINVADLEEAEVEIVKQVQRDVFLSEIRSLQDIQANVKYGSRALGKEKKAALKKSSSLHTGSISRQRWCYESRLKNMEGEPVSHP